MNNIIRFFSVVIFGLVLLQPVFATEKIETIISYTNINDKAFYDIELLVSNEKVFLPFKQLSELFEVKAKTNHSNKEIEFPGGKVGKNYIEFNGKKISTSKNYYIKKGLMDEIQDEIFCSAKDLSIVFDSNIKIDKNDLSVIIFTDKKLEFLETDNLKTSDLPKIRAYTNIFAPNEERKLLFNSISLNNNTMSDTISQYVLNGTKNQNMFFNNNTQILLKGKAFGGDLGVDLNTYNYKGELFSFGGLGFNYHNKFKNFDYEVGRVRGIKDEDYTIANQTLGLQISNYESKKTSYRDIEGYVDKESLAKVFIDDKEYTTLSTYDGYYSLNNIFLNEKPQSVRIEELKPDGTTETILGKVYKKYDNMPSDGEKKYTILGGVTGYNNKLFNTNGYIYEMNTKKALLASEFEYGIKDNLKFNSKLSMDKIFSKPQNSIWQSFYSADSLLTSGTWKNPNNLEGFSSLNTFEYIKNDFLKYKTSFGASIADSPGYTLTAQAEYAKKNYSFKSGLFNTSSDFYLAGSDGSYINDRTGGFLRGSLNGKNSGIECAFKKYFSNMDKKFEGGLLDFNEYSLSVNKSFEKIADFRFNINGRDGSNSTAHNSSYYYDLNISKKIRDYLTLQGGKTASNYQTSYNKSSYDDFKSLYSTVYLKADYKIPKNLGTLTLGHDVVNYDYSNSSNKYNMMKIGYTFPEIKRITLSLGTGYKYTGSDNGFDFSTNLAYRTKSGRTVNINYQYNQMGGYIINNMYLPMNSRHSINLVLNDAFAVLPSGLKSVGFNDDNRGYVEASAYIDKNKNGKFDKGDIPIKDVPVKFSWVNNEIYTKKNGKAIPIGTEAGIYSVKIDEDKLNSTLYQAKGTEKEKIVRIDKGKTTSVQFPLKSCVGNISGNLKIIDDFNRKKEIDEFIVVIHNELDEEVSYSTVNRYGDFYFSGIEPGKYTIKLDKSFIEANALEQFEDKSILNIEIPYTYKNFVDINNLKLIYKTN